MEKKEINKDIEYNRRKDRLPSSITLIIIAVAILTALYLGFFVVV